jgi:hypothetical protein
MHPYIIKVEGLGPRHKAFHVHHSTVEAIADWTVIHLIVDTDRYAENKVQRPRIEGRKGQMVVWPS